MQDNTQKIRSRHFVPYHKFCLDNIKPNLQLETENNHNHNYKPTRVCSSPNLTKKDKHIFQTNVYHKKRRPQSIFNLTSTSKKQHNNDCKSFSETSDKKTKKKNTYMIEKIFLNNFFIYPFFIYKYLTILKKFCIFVYIIKIIIL